MRNIYGLLRGRLPGLLFLASSRGETRSIENSNPAESRKALTDRSEIHFIKQMEELMKRHMVTAHVMIIIELLIHMSCLSGQV
ncbi:hypothetical protein GGI35DRAFT_433840 [Trichoderma velutinum]